MIAVDTIIQVECWIEVPTLYLIGEISRQYWFKLKSILRSGKIVGPHIHDARIAAICIENGVECLWTADRDYSRFPELSTKNPLI